MASVAEAPLVSIIILVYEGLEFLPKCLESVLRQSYRPIEVIVVDNASTDGSVEVLRCMESKITLIESPINLGFSKGMNLGLDQANGEYVLFLAQDIVLDEKYLETVIPIIQHDQTIGLISGSIYDATSLELRYCGMRVCVGPRLRQTRLAFGRDISTSSLTPQPTDAVPGCVALGRTDLIMRVGGFDPDFFMYYEDWDLSFVLTRGGYRNLVVPGAKAFHLEHGLGIEKNYKNEFIRSQVTRGLYRFYFKHATFGSLLLFCVRYVLLGTAKHFFLSRWKSDRLVLESKLWAIRNLPYLVRKRLTAKKLTGAIGYSSSKGQDTSVV